MTFKTGICNFCGTGCGHFLKIEDNRIKGVAPSQRHPVSRGRLCVRGWHIHELLQTDERIYTPLVKKNGQFEISTYEEAIALILNKLSQLHSPGEALGILGSARSANEDNYLLMKLGRTVFKTNNISVSSESGHRNSLNVLHKGSGMAGALGSLAEIAQAKYILVVGADITRLNPIIGSNIHMAVRQGSHLTTLCSTKTQIARLSQVHLQQRPGTKRLVLDGLARVLVEENRYEASFIQKKTEGFKEYSEALLKLNPEQIAAETGISAAEIQKEARILAQAESVMILFSSGISGLDEETITSLFNLFALTGKIGQVGSGIIPATGICNLQGCYDMGLTPDLKTGFRIDPETLTRPGQDVFKLLADDKSKLQALFVVDHDEGIIRYAERLKKMAFIVYLGAFQNPFAEYADIVLPVAAYCEYDGTYTSADRRVSLSRKKTEAPPHIVPAWQLYEMLAQKAGATWNYGSSEGVFTEIARVTPTYSGLSHAKLAAGFGIQWPCNAENPEGCARFNLEKAARKITFLRRTSQKTPPLQTPEYPISLMIGKAQHFWHQNNLMRKTFIPRREFDATLLLYPQGYIEICPADAKKLEVRDRWKVKVFSPTGQMPITVKISDDVQPGTAYIPYFIKNMITEFLVKQDSSRIQGEEAVIPIRIEKG